MIVALGVLAATDTTTHAAPAAQGPYFVVMQDYQFVPPTLTVRVGSTVTWTNTGTMPHTATADNLSFDIQLNPGESLGHTFGTPGPYAYHCMYHGAVGGVGMAGIIVVQ